MDLPLVLMRDVVFVCGRFRQVEEVFLEESLRLSLREEVEWLRHVPLSLQVFLIHASNRGAVTPVQVVAQVAELAPAEVAQVRRPLAGRPAG